MARSRDHQRVQAVCRAAARRLEARVIRPGEGVRIDNTGVYPLPGCTIVTRSEVDELRAEVARLRRLVYALLWLLREAR